MSAANAVPSPGRTLRVLALALCASPLFVLVAVVLVLPPSEGELSLPVGLVVLALVAAAGVPSMLFHVLVRRSTVDRVRTGLESGGARSSLEEGLAA